MKKLLLAAAAIAAFSMPWVVAAQQPAAPAADPSFEVASIKRNSSGENFVRMGGPPGRFTATNVPLRTLIIQAYQIQPTQLVGGPDWIATERFDINATTGTPAVPIPGPFAGGRGNPVAPLLRSLLADRFKLKVHTEQREMPVYALVVREPGKLGPALTPTKADCAAMMAARGRGDGPPPAPAPGVSPAPGQQPPCSFMMGPGSLAASSVPLSELARSLSPRLGRIVVDRTDLAGLYDFTVTFAPESAGGPGGPAGAVVGGGAPPPGAVALPAVDPNAPSLFTAIQEQLGLRLDSVRAPIEVVVIDAVERPTED